MSSTPLKSPPNINTGQLNWYKLPKVKYAVIRVHPPNEKSLAMLSIVSPSRLADMLAGQVIKKGNDSCVLVQITPKCSVQFKVVDFRLHQTGVDVNPISESDAIFTKSTQIIPLDDPQLGFVFQGSNSGPAIWEGTIRDLPSIVDSYVVNTLRHLAATVLSTPFPFLSTAIESSVRSVQLFGESGAGLTTLALSLCGEFTVPAILINANSLFSVSGSSYRKLITQAFSCAIVVQPCILLLDDLETICSIVDSDSDSAILAIREAIEDNMKQLSKGNCKHRVFVIGLVREESTAKPSSRSNREGIILNCFDEQIVLPLPSTLQRRLIVSKAIASYRENYLDIISVLNDIDAIDADAWADQLVGMPTISLVNHIDSTLQAYIDSVGQQREPQLMQSTHGNILRAFSEEMQLCYCPMLTKSKNNSNLYHIPTKSSAICGVDRIEKNFGLYGHKVQLKRLIECIIWPRKYASIYSAYRFQPEIGILLFGPPGTGKTMLPAVAAAFVKCPLLNIRLSDVVKGTIGTGEKAIRDIFSEARRCSPCIVFIDEFQAIFAASNQSDSSNNIAISLSSTLSACFDDVENWNRYSGCDAHVVVIASTNEPWAVDKRFLRSGRFGVQLYIGALDLEGRTEFLADWYVEQKKRALAYEAVDYANPICTTHGTAAILLTSITKHEIEWIADIAVRCNNYSAADMQLLVQRVCLAAFNELVALPTFDHFESVLRQMSASISEADNLEFLNWQASLKLLR